MPNRLLLLGLQLWMFCLLALPALSATEAILPPIQQMRLANGLDVMVLPDPKARQIHASLLIKAGDAQEPFPETAHLLEHLLFKGTDQLGTLDAAAEAVLLTEWEQVWEAYRVAPADKRQALVDRLDALETQLTRAMVPQELDRILSTLGVEHNAFTGSSYTRFEGVLPPSRLESWLRLESERLRAPVLRNYRQELQVVYNEKTENLSEPNRLVLYTLLERLYPGHALGQYRQALTRPEQLPSLTALREFFAKWYVPGNMALVLQGPIDLNTVRPLLEKTLARWPAREQPPLPETPEPLKKTAYLEVEAPGSPEVHLAWRVPFNTPGDQMRMMMMQELLDSQMGLLNYLPPESDISTAWTDIEPKGQELVFSGRAEALSAEGLTDTEKELRQLLAKAANQAPAAEVLAAIRRNLGIWLQSQMESPEDRIELIKEALVHNSTPEAWLRGMYDSLETLSLEEIQAPFRAMLKQPGVVLYRQPGEAEAVAPLPDPPALQTLEPGSFSPFGKSLLDSAGSPAPPRPLQPGVDYTRLPLSDTVPLYHVPNPYNQLYKLELNFRYGDAIAPGACQVLQLVNRVGTDKLPARRFYGEVYRLGGQKLDVRCYPWLTTLTLEGPDETFDELWALAERWLRKPDLFDSLWRDRMAYEDQKREFRRTDPQNLHLALREWLIYGERSIEFESTSVEQMQTLSIKDYGRFRDGLLSRLHRIQYSGPLSPEQLKARLLSKPLIKDSLARSGPIAALEPYKVAVPLTAPVQIYYVPAVTDANWITLQVPGPLHRTQDAATGQLLAEYFGGGRMSGPLMKELREARSLIYSGFVSYTSEERAGDQDLLEIDFQAAPGKTLDALRAAMAQLNYPGHSGLRLDDARQALLNRWTGSTPSFRDLPYLSYLLDYKGLPGDPLPARWQQLNALSDRDFFSYLDAFLKGSKVIAVTGQLSKAQLAELAQLGKVIVVDPEEILP